MKKFRKTIPWIQPYMGYILGSIVLTVLYSASNVLVMPWIRDVLNEIGDKDLSHFQQQMINGVLLWTARVATNFGQLYLTAWVSNRVAIDMQLMFFKKLSKMSQHFYSEWKLGDLITRLFGDTSKVQQTVLSIFWELLPQTLTFIGVLGYMFYTNWKLTLITCITLPVFFMLIDYYSRKLKKIAKPIQEKQSDISHISQEAISNIKLTQAYTMEAYEYHRMESEQYKNFQFNMMNVRTKANMRSIIVLLQGAVILTLLFFGGRSVSTGGMTGPQLAEFFTGILLLIDPISALSKVIAQIQEASVSLDRVQEVLEAPILIKDSEHAIERDIKGVIEFENVSFQYSKRSTKAIDSFSLTIKKGEMAALVGLSGAGKTTLINFVPRFYDPTEGVLKIDGIDIKDYKLQSLRSQIAMVLQDDIIFHGSILDNIRYGAQEATEAEVIEAAKKANAWEFISEMPEGIHSKAGDRGQRLSGGQKQRISIARAILRNPKILILDEATSALDSKSEHLVQEALNKLMKDRTTLVIAHRLSTILHADKIVVMDHGKIMEVGTHEELLEKGKEYHKLYKMQFKSKKS